MMVSQAANVHKLNMVLISSSGLAKGVETSSPASIRRFVFRVVDCFELVRVRINIAGAFYTLPHDIECPVARHCRHLPWFGNIS